jgi:hypothetical protein
MRCLERLLARPRRDPHPKAVTRPGRYLEQADVADELRQLCVAPVAGVEVRSLLAHKRSDGGEIRPPVIPEALVGIDYFRQLNVSWGQLMAYATLITIPVLALFIAFQRSFVNSIASSGVRDDWCKRDRSLSPASRALHAETELDE